VFKVVLSVILLSVATFLVFFYRIGGDYWHISLLIGLAIVIYLGYYLKDEMADLTELKDFIKLFRAGQTDILTELLKNRKYVEVIADLKIACLEYIQNVYINRVRYVLKTLNLNRIEAVYLDELLEHLEAIEEIPESEMNTAFDKIYDFNFDLLRHSCECNEAQQCLDTGETICRFLWKYHFFES
jgi:hypothetical protein